MSFKNNFFLRQILLLLLSAILLWLIFDYTNIDIYLSGIFYDAGTDSWPYYSGYITIVGYYGVKYMLVLYGIILLALLAYSYKNHYWRERRIVIAFLLLSLTVIPLEISFLKHTFHKPNPSQVILFGGTMPHVRLAEFLSNESKANNWPGGHASGGAALLSLYFVGRYCAPKRKYIGLVTGLAISQLMGFVQVMRGQHFFSHNLWTVWFAWLTLLVLYFVFFRLRFKFMQEGFYHTANLTFRKKRAD